MVEDSNERSYEQVRVCSECGALPNIKDIYGLRIRVCCQDCGKFVIHSERSSAIARWNSINDLSSFEKVDYVAHNARFCSRCGNRPHCYNYINEDGQDVYVLRCLGCDTSDTTFVHRDHIGLLNLWNYHHPVETPLDDSEAYLDPNDTQLEKMENAVKTVRGLCLELHKEVDALKLKVDFLELTVNGNKTYAIELAKRIDALREAIKAVFDGAVQAIVDKDVFKL